MGTLVTMRRDRWPRPFPSWKQAAEGAKMLEKLELKPRRFRSYRESAFSLVLHLAIGYAAIQATAGAVEKFETAKQDTTIVYLKAPKPPPPPPRFASPPPPAAVALADPPPLGFQTVIPPTTMPLDIPLVELSERFNAADFSGKGVEGGVAAGARGGTGPVTRAEPFGGAPVFVEAQVDEPVELVTIPTPRYPPALRLAGIAGRLAVQYVVDTTGHAEPGSWRVLRTTNAAFEDPAREAIMQGRFNPARIKGRPVRQLVQQTVVFTISGGDL